MCNSIEQYVDEYGFEWEVTTYYYKGGAIKSIHVFPKGNIHVIHDLEDREKDRLHYWTLIGKYFKEDVSKWDFETQNARIENLESSKLYNKLLHQRCIIPIKAFHEWKHYGKDKVPYRIFKRDQSPMYVAGLWEFSLFHKLYTATMVTTPANRLMEDIHHTKKRMPAILTEEEARFWLDGNVKGKEALELIKPYPDAELQAYALQKSIPDFDRFVYPERSDILAEIAFQ
jgi:putative SOS response-associated peptidase YedK